MYLRKRLIAGLIACSFALSTLGCNTASVDSLVTPESQALLKSFGLTLTQQDATQTQQINVKAEEIESVMLDDNEVPKADMEIKDGLITFKNMTEGDHVIKIKYKNIKDYVKLPIKVSQANPQAKLVQKINKDKIEMAEGGISDASGKLQEDYIINPATAEEDYHILKRDSTGKIVKIKFDAGYKVSTEREYPYAAPGLGLINPKTITSLVFIVPNEVKKEENRIIRAWVEDIDIPLFAVTVTKDGNFSVASTFLNKFKADKKRMPKYTRIAVSKTSGKVLYSMVFKKELLSIKEAGNNTLFKDFVIYTNKKPGVINNPPPVAPKQLGWTFIAEPSGKNIGKIRKAWVNGEQVPTSSVQFGKSPKTKAEGLLVDIKEFTTKPFLKEHKVVILTEVTEKAGEKPKLVREGFKVKVKFPKEVMDLIKKALLAKQPTLKTQAEDEDEFVEEDDWTGEDIFMVDEEDATMDDEPTTDAIIEDESEVYVTDEDEIPSMEELIGSNELVSEDDVEATDEESIDMPEDWEQSEEPDEEEY